MANNSAIYIDAAARIAYDHGYGHGYKDGCIAERENLSKGQSTGELAGYAQGYEDGSAAEKAKEDKTRAAEVVSTASLKMIAYQQGFDAGASKGYEDAEEVYKKHLEQKLTGDEDMDALLNECLKVLTVKGNDYTQGKGNLDRLNNFTSGATALGLQPRQVLAVYLYKHLTAVLRYLKEGQVESEPIEGRIVDCINYFLLLGKMIAHEKVTAKVPPPDKAAAADERHASGGLENHTDERCDMCKGRKCPNASFCIVRDCYGLICKCKEK